MSGQSFFPEWALVSLSAPLFRPRDPRMWQALADNYKNMNLLMAAAQVCHLMNTGERGKEETKTQ